VNPNFLSYELETIQDFLAMAPSQLISEASPVDLSSSQLISKASPTEILIKSLNSEIEDFCAKKLN
jgi:hypothetical protein